MLYQTINLKNIARWACSSMVERYVDIVEAISSILITPTSFFLLYKNRNKYYNDVPGDYCEGVIPDPIPNSEVKPFSADGTLS